LFARVRTAHWCATQGERTWSLKSFVNCTEKT
jgi:hypothetical protein